jgi:hypothetical protein
MKFAPKPDGRYANDLEVTLWAIDSKNGKVKDGSRDVVGVVLRPQVTEMRTPVPRPAQAAGARRQVPAAHRREEDGGKVGTVIYDLEAPDFARADRDERHRRCRPPRRARSRPPARPDR